MAKLFKSLFVLGMALLVAPAARAVNLSVVTSFLKKKFAKPVVNGVGVIKITGGIRNENAEKLMKKIIALEENSAIKGIFLVVDSNGGSSGSSELLFRELKNVSEKKPVVTLVADFCLSGAYKIAAGSHWIVAPGAASVGSIGTRFTIEKHKNVRMKHKGYTADPEREIFHHGKYKVITDPHSPALDKESRALMQGWIDDLGQTFCTIVARERKLSLDKKAEWADGKNFSGNQALKLGLIDQVGGYSDAVKKLRELMKERGSLVDGKLNFIE